MKEILTAIVFGFVLLTTYWAIMGTITTAISSMQKESAYFLKKKTEASVIMDLICTFFWMLFYYITH